MNTKGRLRPIVAEDLTMLLGWRNSPAIRRFMYSNHEIKQKEHLAWYDAVKADPDRHPLLFLLDERPSGFVNIGPIKRGGIADWGFYTAPSAEPGTGYKMGACALKFAFQELRLHKLCGEALGHNRASRRYHLRLGFIEEGELQEHYFDGANYHNIIYFGLTASHWLELMKSNKI